MHWRLQQIFHGLSRIKHAFTDKQPGHLRTEVSEPDFLSRLAASGGSIAHETEDKIEISFNGGAFILRNSGSDKAVFREIFWTAEYEMLLKFIRLNNIKINNGVDIGANIGLATRYLLTELRPVSWLCIEPFKDNMQLCKQNNAQYSFIQYQEAAFWHEQKSEVFLNRNFRDGADWALSVSNKPEGINLGPVPVIRLQEILATPGFQQIDLVKIDIEGAEHIIFSDKTTLKSLANVLIFCIEVHREPIGYKKLFERLQSAGFILFESGNNLIGINREMNY
jgi:FkbM family methyltransferase